MIMTPRSSGLEKNLRLLPLLNFLDGLWFPLPISVVYLLDHNIGLAQLGLLLSLSTLMQFLLDIPSSILADRHSRRTVLIASALFYLLSDIAFFFADSFILFAFAFCLSGMSNALASGIFSALTYDTLLSLGREKEYDRVQARVAKGFFLGRVLASLAGTYLYVRGQKLVFIAAIAANLVLLTAICFLQEPVREKSISKSWLQVHQGLDFLLDNRKIWRLVILFSLLMATSDSVFSYYQPALRAAGFAVADLGMVYALVNILSYLGAGLYGWVRRRLGWRKLMLTYLLIDLSACLCLGTQLALPVLTAIAFLSLAFGSQNIFIGGIIHRTVPSSHRATTLSIQSQMYMFFYSAIMLGVGCITDRISLAAGMLLNASIVILASLSFAIVSGREQAVAPEI